MNREIYLSSLSGISPEVILNLKIMFFKKFRMEPLVPRKEQWKRTHHQRMTTRLGEV